MKKNIIHKKQITWVKYEDENSIEYTGYINGKPFFTIEPLEKNWYRVYVCFANTFSIVKDYTTLRSAKRGAERFLSNMQKIIK